MNEQIDEQVVLLNLGSGQRPFPKPWVNVDAQSKWEPDLVGDLEHDSTWDRLHEAYPNGVDVICLHHVLEHFGLMEGKHLLERCYKLLKNRGTLWVFVPDLRALSQAYIQGKLDHYQFAVNLYGAYMGDECDRHKWGYDVASLSRQLQGVGYSFVCPVGAPVSLYGADIAQDWWILGMEAVKIERRANEQQAR